MSRGRKGGGEGTEDWPLCKDWILSLNCKAAFGKFNARLEGSRPRLHGGRRRRPTSTSTNDATAVRKRRCRFLSSRSFRRATRSEGGNSIRSANYRGESDTALANSGSLRKGGVKMTRRRHNGFTPLHLAVVDCVSCNTTEIVNSACFQLSIFFTSRFI